MCLHPAASNSSENDSRIQSTDRRTSSTASININDKTTTPRTDANSSSETTQPVKLVSFANDSSDSTAYREHNPPAVLRKQEAARREGAPPQGGVQSVQNAPPQNSQQTQSLQSSSSNLQVDSSSQFNKNNARVRSVSPPSRPYTPTDSLRSTTVKPVTNDKGPNTIKPTKSPTNSYTSHPSPSTPSPSSYGPYNPGVTCNLPPNYNKLPNEPHPSHVNQILNKQDEVHILVAVTGSVATIKLPLIIHKLKQIYQKRAIIQVVATKSASHFFDPEDLPQGIRVWYDHDEWRSRMKHGVNETTAHVEQQLHIQLRRWADILLVAPCSANTLAKLTYGICDNLLTSIFRVWNPEVPILIAPAMNTHMYTNPVTKRHFNVLKQFFPFVDILKPVEKVLVCGDIGMGGMREWTDIVQLLVKRIGVPLDTESEDEDTDSE